MSQQVTNLLYLGTIVCFILALLAVVLGTINVVGGFVVTDRMLEMFKRRPTRAGDSSEQ